jgi:hypothetical protein
VKVRITRATLGAVLAALDDAAGFCRAVASAHGCGGPCAQCQARREAAGDYDQAAGVLAAADPLTDETARYWPVSGGAGA